MTLDRIRALLDKELTELRRTPMILLPVAIMAAVAIATPFFLAIGIPLIVGGSLSDDEDFTKTAVAAARYLPELRALGVEAIVQAFVFQQFLLLLSLIPVTGAMAIAAHSVIGEKQGRTLEPLLATPLSTAELLLTKVLAAMLPSVAVAVLAFAAYMTGLAALAAEGVFEALLSLRTLFIVLGLGPLAALVALQLAVLVSSRVNDARTAQQVGVLIVLPITGLLVAQTGGAFFLTGPFLLLMAAGLLAVWVALVAAGIALFDRETILTKWK